MNNGHNGFHIQQTAGIGRTFFYLISKNDKCVIIHIYKTSFPYSSHFTIKGNMKSFLQDRHQNTYTRTVHATLHNKIVRTPKCEHPTNNKRLELPQKI